MFNQFFLIINEWMTGGLVFAGTGAFIWGRVSVLCNGVCSLWMVFVFLLIPVFGMAQTSSDGPVADLVEEIHEFQPVVEGTTVTHQFILKNRGGAPLSILDIKSG